MQVYDQTKRNNEIQSFFGEVYCQILRYLNIQLEDRLTEIVLNHVLFKFSNNRMVAGTNQWISTYFFAII